MYTKHPFHTVWTGPIIDDKNSMYTEHDKCYNESIEHKITDLPITAKHLLLS